MIAGDPMATVPNDRVHLRSSSTAGRVLPHDATPPASGAPAAREAWRSNCIIRARATPVAEVTTANLREPQLRRCDCPSANIALNFTNPLAIADLIAHGNNNTRGWGQDIQPDQNLLFVRGFDPVSKQFKYSVNDRFGSTRPQQSASRSAAFVSINVSYDIGFTRERQMLTQRLDVGRGRWREADVANTQGVWHRINSESDVDDPSATGFAEAHAAAADSLATLSTKFSRYADSV
jgi:hypothetical protein